MVHGWLVWILDANVALYGPHQWGSACKRCLNSSGLGQRWVLWPSSSHIKQGWLIWGCWWVANACHLAHVGVFCWRGGTRKRGLGNSSGEPLLVFYSTEVLAMVGTNRDVPSGQIKSIWIWIRWFEMVLGPAGSRYHTDNPNVMFTSWTMAMTRVATTSNGGNKNGILMNCPTIGWEGKASVIWVFGMVV